VRLTDFLRDRAALDPSDVATLRYGGVGSPHGRVILEDLRLSPR
jgi:hypothetical protein